MQFNLNEFLKAISQALDFIEIDALGATSNHTKRVVYICLRIANELGLSEDEKFDLTSFAFLHDNGLSEELLKAKKHRLDGTTAQEEILRSYRLHCKIGEKNVEEFPFLTQTRNVILFHHETYDGKGFYQAKGEEIPLMAQIISMADTVDNLFHFEIPTNENHQQIRKYICEDCTASFSPKVIAAFKKISDQTSFWLDLQTLFVEKALDGLIPEKSFDFDLKKIYKITSVFSSIIDSKSKFTQCHSSGLTEKVERMAGFYNFSDDHTLKLKIAASLHDLGKLGIPNEILDKEAALTADEYEIIKTHTYYTRSALSNIAGFEEITNWAANHHEKLNGKGYPYGFNERQLGFEERLMSCLDIYQALTEDRPYRKGMPHMDAMSILHNMADQNLIDKTITKDVEMYLGQFATN